MALSRVAKQKLDHAKDAKSENGASLPDSFVSVTATGRPEGCG
jgi:hypothetical protein